MIMRKYDSLGGWTPCHHPQKPTPASSTRFPPTLRQTLTERVESAGTGGGGEQPDEAGGGGEDEEEKDREGGEREEEGKRRLSRRAPPPPRRHPSVVNLFCLSVSLQTDDEGDSEVTTLALCHTFATIMSSTGGGHGDVARLDQNVGAYPLLQLHGEWAQDLRDLPIGVSHFSPSREHGERVSWGHSRT